MGDTSFQFHRALCLVSLSIGCLQLARATKYSSTEKEDQIIQEVSSLWCGEDNSVVALTAKDCLAKVAVFHFLYHDLLDRLLPIERITPWIAAYPDEWTLDLLQRHNTRHEATVNAESRAALLEWCCRTLIPVDLADLCMAHRNGEAFPQNAHEYLKERGAFELTGRTLDWASPFTWQTLVDKMPKNNPTVKNDIAYRGEAISDDILSALDTGQSSSN